MLPLLSLGSGAGMQGVFNCRAVSPRLPGLYRSANLEQATAADAALLLDRLRVRTIVDLRNRDEIEEAEAKATGAGRSLLRAFQTGAPVGPGCVASEGQGVLSRHHVPLLGDVDAFLDEVATRLPPSKKIKARMLRNVNIRKQCECNF